MASHSSNEISWESPCNCWHTKLPWNYDAGQWVLYYQFRREALARKDLNWSITDPWLYNEAFIGRAHSILRYTFWLQDDHVSPQCPQNPNRLYLRWLSDIVILSTPIKGPAVVQMPLQSPSCQGLWQKFVAVTTRVDASRFAAGIRMCVGTVEPVILWSCACLLARPARPQEHIRSPNRAVSMAVEGLDLEKKMVWKLFYV